MPRLDLVFVEVTEKNVEQLRLMNELIFPVRYNDQFYKDVYKNQKLAQFGAPTLVDLPASPRYPVCTYCGRLAPHPAGPDTASRSSLLWQACTMTRQSELWRRGWRRARRRGRRRNCIS